MVEKKHQRKRSIVLGSVPKSILYWYRNNYVVLMWWEQELQIHIIAHKGIKQEQG